MTISVISHLLHEHEEQREAEANTLYNNFARPDLQLQAATSAVNPTPVAAYLKYESQLTRSYNVNERPLWVVRGNRGW